VAGGYRIGSYFDVRIEIRLDDGASWSPADSTATVVLSAPDSYSVILRPGYNLIANHLNAGNNNINLVIPVFTDGGSLFKWNNDLAAFENPQMCGSAFGGWVDSIFGAPSTTTLSPGETALIQNPNPAAYVLTFTGAPQEPSLPMPLEPGHSYGYRMPTPASEPTIASRAGRRVSIRKVLTFNPDTQAYDTYKSNHLPRRGRLRGRPHQPGVCELHLPARHLRAGPRLFPGERSLLRHHHQLLRFGSRVAYPLTRGSSQFRQWLPSGAGR
jgi:hypothetical protein